MMVMLVGSGDLHQFDAIAEGIEDVRAAVTIYRRVFASRESGALAGQDNFVEVVDDECRMRAASCVKIGIGFDTEMKIHRAGHEPNTVASG